MMYTDTTQSRKENENIDQFSHIICCKYVITSEFLNELSEFPPTKMSLMPKDNKFLCLLVHTNTQNTHPHTITHM